MRPPARPRPFFARGAARVLLLVLVTGMAGAVASADDSALYDSWREDLTRPGNGPGVWNGVLGELGKQPDAPLAFRAVLQPLFSEERTTDENVRRLLGHVAAYLLQTADPAVFQVLAASLLDALAHNPALVKETVSNLTLDPQTRRRAGWDRLYEFAASQLESGDARIRRNAIWILSHQTGGRALDSIGILLKHAKLAAAANDQSTKYFREAFARLLGHEFSTLQEAVDWLEKQGRWIEGRDRWTPRERAMNYAQLLLAIIDLNRQNDPDRARAIKYGRRVIRTASGPAELREFLAPDEYVELQTAALDRARELEPANTPEWVDLITAVLASLPEDAALNAVLVLLAHRAFGKDSKQESPEHARKIVTAVRERLTEFATTDTPARRRTLVRTLGVLGTSDDVEAALSSFEAQLESGVIGPQVGVFAELVRAAGEVDDALVEKVARHYFREGEGLPRPDEVRRAAAEALGSESVRSNPQQRALAAVVLRLIVRGVSADDPLPPWLQDLALGFTGETVARVRDAALDKMQHYPDAATTQLLQEIAAGEDAKEAKFAWENLGKLLRVHGIAAAAEALAALLGDAALPQDRVLAILAEVAAAPAAARPLVRPSVRKLLNEGAGPIQKAAAKASIALHDAEVLGTILARWRAEKDEFWTEQLRALFGSLSANGEGGGAHDAALVAVIEELGDSGDEREFVEALGLASRLADQTKRLPFRLKEGALYERRAEIASRTDDQKKQDLENAVRAYQQVAASGIASLEQRLDARKRAYALSMKRAQLGEHVEWHMTAARAAVESEDADVAREALGKDGPVEKLRGATISPGDQAQLKDFTTRLQQLAAAGAGDNPR